MPAPTPEWLATQYHSGRFDLRNAHYYVLRDSEHDTLTKAFNNLAVETADGLRLEKESFLDAIRSQLPKDLPLSFAENVYRILAYHSTAPFYLAPSAPLPQSLSLLDVQRALVWLVPDRHLHMSNVGNAGRLRTPADQRRLLFQSLATRNVSTPNNPINEAARRRYAHRNAFDAEHVKEHAHWCEDINEALNDYCKTNRDDDGDEMYHDLLDVLQKNVPENYPYGSFRDDLRPLAKELKADFEFHSLAISKAELDHLVRALLLDMFESSTEPTDLEVYDDTVASVMATFACEEDDIVAAFPTAHDVVAWPAFDQGLQQIAGLFDPVYRVLTDVFLDGNAFDAGIRARYKAPPKLQIPRQANEPYVLSLGWMALTDVVVPHVVDYETLHTVARWHHSSDPKRTTDALPDSEAIWPHICPQATKKESYPPCSIMAFSGHVRATGERFVGGILVAADYDKNDGRSFATSLHFFRLTHSVRYAKFPDFQWRREAEGELAFGETRSSPRFNMRVDTMVAELELPGLGEPQTIEIDAWEVWQDDEE